MGQSRATEANQQGISFADGAQKERFAEHFPKVFAYALSWTGDEEHSREIVIEAFARVFSRGTPAHPEDFTVALYGTTRDLCSGARKVSKQAEGGLNDPEREVLALLFDAQLSRGQVSSLLKMPEDTVVTTLVNGLRKLKRAATSGARPAVQQQA